MYIVKSIPLEGDRDADQLKVIQADSTVRLVIDAGPGTGKTAVLHWVRSHFSSRRLLSGWVRGPAVEPRCDRGGSSPLRASGGSKYSNRYGVPRRNIPHT